MTDTHGITIDKRSVASDLFISGRGFIKYGRRGDRERARPQSLL